jgi:serine racemase
MGPPPEVEKSKFGCTRDNVTFCVILLIWNMTSSPYCIAFEDVQCAASRIQGTAYQTTVLTSASLNDAASRTSASPRKLFFKVEALQRTGSFKFRGALNAVRSLLEQEDNRTTGDLQVVTHSSGNHAQALALAAKLSSTSEKKVVATIVMPESTPLVKKNAVVAFGGIPVMTSNTNEARESEATRIRDETGAVFIHPSEDPRVIAGQGTVCLELVRQAREEMNVELDVVIIPVGGGGLAAGNAITLRALLGDKIKIVLAEPEMLDDAKRSFESKALLKHDPENTLNSVADGLKTTLGPNTWPIIRDFVDDVISVSELDILRATKLVWERLKVCIEPSAGVGVAVALSDTFHERFSDAKNVGIVLCGGNVDVVRVAALMRDMGL